MKIPKIIHRIWIGPNPLPKKYKQYCKSWEKKHHGWKFKLWNNSNLPKLQNQAIYDQEPTWSGKSDILRYEIIYRFGGVYIDTDIECIRNIDDLINDLDIFGNQDRIRLKKGHNDFINLCIFGAVKKHPVIKLLIDKLPVWLKKDPIKNSNAFWRTGPGFQRWALFNKRLILLPVNTFDGIYAVHHATFSWATAQKGSENSYRP